MSELNSDKESKEKEYVFIVSKGIDSQERIAVKESELTKPQKDLLIGETIKAFNNMPEELKDKFIYDLMNSLREYRLENPSPRVKQMRETLIKDMTERIIKEVGDE